MSVARSWSTEGDLLEDNLLEDDLLEDGVSEEPERNSTSAVEPAAGEAQVGKGRFEVQLPQKRTDEKEGLKDFMYRNVPVLMFLLYPSTTNIIFTQLRPCRQFMTPLPQGSEYMWNDYTIQVA